jgi:hypothetical protein
MSSVSLPSSSLPSSLLDGYYLVPKPINSSDLKSDEKSDPPVVANNNSTLVIKADVATSSLTAMVRSSGKSRSRGKSALPGDGKTWAPLSMGIPNMRFKFPDNKVYKFIQMAESPSFITGTVAPTNFFGGYSFTSASIQQFSSFAAVFDQYRITMVEVWLYASNPQVPSGASVSRGELLSVVDYDDATALSSISALQEYQNCVQTPAYIGHYRKFKPHIATAAYSGTFASYANMTDQWIDCSSTGVQYYGLKVGLIGADSAANIVVLNQLVRVHAEFRNLR